MRNLWRQRSGAGAYALATGLAVAATLLHLAIAPWVGTRVQFLFFLPAIALAAAIAGRGPAVLILLAGAANSLLLLPALSVPAGGTDASRLAVLAYLAVGLVLALLGSRVSVIGRRAAEAEERLRLAQEDAGVGLFEVDFGHKTVFASPVMAQLLGHTPVSGRLSLDEWIAMLPPDEVEKGRQVLRQKLAEGAEGYEREHLVELPGGRERWLMSRVHIERRPDGRALRVRGASVDITRRKEMDLLLRRTQDELRQQVADLQQLHEASSRLLDLPTLAAQLGLILGAVCDAHGARLGIVWLLSRDGQ
ncbi:MAG TPA: PAS domain-containing protein, partial [Albitalea sp.]